MILMWPWEAASDCVLVFEFRVAEGSNGGFMTRIVIENRSQPSNNRFENSIADTRWPTAGVGTKTSSALFMFYAALFLS